MMELFYLIAIENYYYEDLSYFIAIVKNGARENKIVELELDTWRLLCLWVIREVTFMWNRIFLDINSTLYTHIY